MPRYLPTLLLALGLSSASLPPAHAQVIPLVDTEKLIDEGLELYRTDKNAEALDRFQQALKLKPNDFRAQYGTALVYYTTGRYAEAAALCELLVKRGDDKLPNLYVTYGTSLDRQQKSSEALVVYQQAIRKFPADEPLRRYQGIAQQSLNQNAEAAGSFQAAIRLRPDYPTTHLLLAQAEAARNNRIPALLACLRGLMLETNARRGAKAVAMLDKLMQHGVTKNDEKNITLNLSSDLMKQANNPTKKPDDFAQADMLLTMATALDYDKANKDKPAAERLAEKLGQLFRSLDEPKPAQRLGFSWQYYAPFFIELEQKGHTAALAYMVAAQRPEVAPDVTAWLSQNPQQLQALMEWPKAYQWPK